MILFNQAIKHDVNAKERKLLKSILKKRRSQFCDDSQIINISFKLKSGVKWFEDKGMNFAEWQVMTVFHIEMGLWKKEDQEESDYNWYY